MSTKQELIADRNAHGLEKLAAELSNKGDVAESIICAHSALELDYVPARMVFLGKILSNADKGEEATFWLEKGYKQDPSDNHLEALLFHLIKTADLSMIRALAPELEPDSPATMALMGRCHYLIGEREASIEYYRRCLDSEPTSSQRITALNDIAVCHIEDESFNQALETLKLLADAERSPSARTLYNTGICHFVKGEFADALSNFNAIAKTDDYHRLALSYSLHSAASCCNWKNCDEIRAELEALLIDGHRLALSPFYLISRIEDEKLLLAANTNFSNQIPVILPVNQHIPVISESKIRIGFFSADFFDHATAFLMIELLENIDRNRFEVFLISFNAGKVSDFRERMKHACDHFLVIDHMTDVEVANYFRQLPMDIAVDLKGHTKNSRPGIFANRVAPIQINYLGYPGTMGSDFIDFIIADPTLIPQTSEQFFKEKVLRLDGTYQCNSRRIVYAGELNREAFGLPDDKFVFCSFNSPYKLTKEIFTAWTKIIAACQKSVLWVYAPYALARENLLDAWHEQGLATDRLIFADGVRQDVHNARLGLADLALDTHPCNGHTTLSDLLFAGVPSVCLAGLAFQGRVGPSILHAGGFDELITHTIEEYVQTAIRIYNEPNTLEALKQLTPRNNEASKLLDSESFTKKFEQCLFSAIEQT